MAEGDSTLVSKGPCPECGSSDACALYDDGHQHCFSCGQTFQPEGGADPDTVKTRPAKTGFTPLDVTPQGFTKRRLKEDICRKYGYGVAEYGGKMVQVANYKGPNGGPVVAQHIRKPDKTFPWKGDVKAAGLFGQWVYRTGGKMVTVTEGEIDALSVSQQWDGKWPVVSLKRGASGAKKDCQEAYDWLNSFDTIVLYFDDDEPGRAAAEEAGLLFPYGKVKIARADGYKDASDALQDGNSKAIVDAVFGARPLALEGIKDASEVWDTIVHDTSGEKAVEFPWDGLNDKTLGVRPGELVMLCAGTSIGKSAIVREIAYDLRKKGERIGMIMLEETNARTLTGLMGLYLNEPIHLDLTPFSKLPGDVQRERRAAMEAVTADGGFKILDSYQGSDIPTIMGRIRYLAKAAECRWIFLDHVSMLVSGDATKDERRTLDEVATELAGLAVECGIGIFAVSHLSRPAQGSQKPHEEGGPTKLSQLRGSAALGQLPDTVIGLERNQQSADPKIRNTTMFRVLKCRFTGDTGPAGWVFYDKDTGRLAEVSDPYEDTGFPSDEDEDDEGTEDEEGGAQDF